MKQQESQTHISFVLDEDEQVSTLGMKMLGQMEGKNLIKSVLINCNGRDKFVCDVEGMTNLSDSREHITEENKIELIHSLVELSQEIDNNSFLEKEMILLNGKLVYFSPREGTFHFVAIPVLSDRSGGSKRTWLEQLYSFLAAIVVDGREYTDNNLIELKKKLESIASGEKCISDTPLADLIDLYDTVIGLFDHVPQKRNVRKEMKLVYSGIYGDFALFVLKDNFVIGKADDCDGRIPFNGAISRKHGMIENQNGTFFYTDLGSSNHSYINGSLLIPQQKVQIQNGDELRLADMDFKIEITESVG